MADHDCLFCKIVAKEIPGKIVLENDHAVAFRDIHPAAPTHVLVVPRKHIVNLFDANAEDVALLGELMIAARDVAKAEGLEEKGFRVVMNNGAGVGQSVFHVHLHVLGGRVLSWPPG